MNRPVDVSIVIVSFNTKDLTRQCLSCVERHVGETGFEVIVVDNGSRDGSAEMIAEEFPGVILVVLPENRGFAGGNIPGMKQATGRYVLLLNSDAFIGPGVLMDTVSHMDQHPKIGVLGCQLTDPDGGSQPSARMLPGLLNKALHVTGLSTRFPRSRFFGRVDFTWWDHSEPRDVGWVVGAFFLIRRETMAEIGYLDDRYFLYFEEIDYCLTAHRAGWKVVFYPYARVVHLGGQSAAHTGESLSEKGKQAIAIRLESELKYYHKNYGQLKMVLSAGIEWAWYAVVLIRNLFRKSDKGTRKRKQAVRMMKLIVLAFRSYRNKGKKNETHIIEPAGI